MGEPTDGCKWSITMVKDSVAVLAQAGSADSATRTDSLFSHCWVSFSISQDGSISRDQS